VVNKENARMQAALLTSQIPPEVAGWWVSEKLDGVRAIWTGSRLLSRHGKDLKAPAWFTAGLPSGFRLDGEIWMGRGTFDALLSSIQIKGSDWRNVTYHVFDLAESGTFEDREAKLAKIKLPSHVYRVAHRQLSGHADLSGMEAEIVSNGGEGCVIRRPGSNYRPGRMGDVIKVKRLVSDLDRPI
jgi:DNA ligase-1